MAESTKIQWCDDTINPVMGCDGCELWDDARRTCYAGLLHAMRGRTNKGFAPTFEQVKEFPGRMAKASRWSDLRGQRRLDKPWLDGAPRLIFVSDMGDALSAAIPFEYLKQEIIDVASTTLGSRHVWLWLTKRPLRMKEFSGWLAERCVEWPANVWPGTSITAETSLPRARSLLKVGDDTTTRFLSVEPQVERVEFGDLLPRFDWVIQGGESGGKSRPFDLAWARALRDRCREGGVAYFLKQLGARPLDGGRALKLKDRHGGDWTAWPDDLRVREIPESIRFPVVAAFAEPRVLRRLHLASTEPVPRPPAFTRPDLSAASTDDLLAEIRRRCGT